MWHIGGPYICYEAVGKTLNVLNMKSRKVWRYDTPEKLKRPINVAYGSYGRSNYAGEVFLVIIDADHRLWSTKDYGGTFSDITPRGVDQVKQCFMHGAFSKSFLLLFFIGCNDEGKRTLFSHSLKHNDTHSIFLDGGRSPKKIHPVIAPGDKRSSPRTHIFITADDDHIFQFDYRSAYEFRNENEDYHSTHDCLLVTRLCEIIMDQKCGTLEDILWISSRELLFRCEDDSCGILETPDHIASLKHEETTTEQWMRYFQFSSNRASVHMLPSMKRIHYLCDMLVLCDHVSNVSFMKVTDKSTHILEDHIKPINIQSLIGTEYNGILLDMEGNLHTITSSLRIETLDTSYLESEDVFCMDCAWNQGRKSGFVPHVSRKSAIYP